MAFIPSTGRAGARGLLVVIGLLGATACEPPERRSPFEDWLKHDTGNPDSEAPDDSDADADSDTDTDSDADTDSDSDADSDPYVGIEGELTYERQEDGAATCTARLALDGTAFTGDCHECEWAFRVESTLLETEGEDCDLAPLLTLLPDGILTSLYLGYWETYVPWWSEDGLPLTHVLLSGYGGTGWLGPRWAELLAADGALGGGASMDRHTVSWTTESISPTAIVEHFYEACDEVGFSYEEASSSWTEAGFSMLGCDEEESVVDVWRFEAAKGDTVSISVDTVAAESAFDPFLFVNDPDGCTTWTADDNFSCTFPPVEFACPAVVFVATREGTYQAVVSSLASCTGTRAAYEIRIQGGRGLTLELDDAAHWSITPETRTTVLGAATLLR